MRAVVELIARDPMRALAVLMPLAVVVVGLLETAH